jgi:hypothetical protein
MDVRAGGQAAMGARQGTDADMVADMVRQGGRQYVHYHMRFRFSGNFRCRRPARKLAA